MHKELGFLERGTGQDRTERKKWILKSNDDARYVVIRYFQYICKITEGIFVRRLSTFR